MAALWRHLADTADVAGRLWDHWLSPAVRRRIADELPGGNADARTLAIWIAGYTTSARPPRPSPARRTRWPSGCVTMGSDTTGT
ncbi:HD domain-containing protein [Micromonospora sp. M12]